MYDILFKGTKDKVRERVNGSLNIVSKKTLYTALTGSRSLLPMPNGYYAATNLRIRNSAKMAIDVRPEENEGGGMSFPAWSIDLEPLFDSERTLLRIHPDGNLPGTMGCIGITGFTHNCYNDFKKLFEIKDRLTLLVQHDNVNPKINKKPSK